MKYKKLYKRAFPKKYLYKQINNKSVGFKNIDSDIKSKLFKFNNLLLKNNQTKISLNKFTFTDVINKFDRKKFVNYSLVIILIAGLASYATSSRLSNENNYDKTTEVLKLQDTESLTNSKSFTPSTIEFSASNTTVSTTTIPVTTTTLKPTFVVTNIKDAQIQLKNLYIYQGEIDGINGTYTKLSIKEFQKRSGLEPDGILGPLTKAALTNGKNSYINIEQQDNLNLLNYEISQETIEIQEKLSDLNIYTGVIDGVFGFQTMISLKEFQNKAGLRVDGVYGPNSKAALERGEDSFKTIVTDNVVETYTIEEVISSEDETSSNSTLTVDLKNYNPNSTCINGYVNNLNIWVPDPCFYPVLVFRYENVAQVNSQAELDAYLNQNWSLTKEKTYSSLGKVPTQNYSDGYNSPVNGLPIPSGSNNSIVIGIKNDNNVRARPQSGPQSADAVVEVLVEGGMTRFINIFYQSDTTYHGPIRSARPTDPTVLRPVGGVLVASGATGGLIPEIVDMGVPVISDRRPEYFRISSRNAPHNLYADTEKLKQHAINKGYKKYSNPQPLFPWGNPSQSNWKSNSYLKLTFSSYTSTTWTWNGSSYARTYYDAYKNSSNDNVHYWTDKNGNQGQITTTTVIALFCEPYTHPLQLPSVKTVGEGRAIILHKGKLLDARWKRGSNLDPFHIVDSNDNILYVPKGKVWISLVPNTKNPSFG